MSQVNLHPALDKGLHKGAAQFSGGTLQCNCGKDPVKVKVTNQVLYNHACGCTACWKPQGAHMSIVGVVPSDKVEVTQGKEKLKVVDTAALIQRHACTGCGTHMYGPVEKDHAFKGLSFIHSELFQEDGAPAPEFAAFVSSMIEGGVAPTDMEGVRNHLKELGLPYYDCLAPGLMDALATFAAKKKGTLHS